MSVSSRFIRILVLFFASGLLLFIFSAPPARLKPKLTRYDPAGKDVTDGRSDLLKEEHKKAIDEIQTRIEQEDAWFRYKFVVAGALIAFLFTKMIFFNERTLANPEGQLDSLFRSSATYAVLATACVVAVAIDIHIRSSIGVMNQLGSWIAYYVEPARLQLPFDPAHASQHNTAFLPWEQFLRHEDPEFGMQRDPNYGMLFWPHLHILTFVMYMAYLYSLQETCLHGRPHWRGLIVTGFAAVHVSLGAFTWVAHSAPNAFEMYVFILRWWKDVPTCPALYLIPWSLLIALGLPYLLPLFGFKRLLERPYANLWRMSVSTDKGVNFNAGYFKIAGGVLEIVPGDDKGLCWYAGRAPREFILALEWTCRHAKAQSGVFIGFPRPDSRGYANTAYVAKHFGLLVAINHSGDDQDRVIYKCVAAQATNGSDKPAEMSGKAAEGSPKAGAGSSAVLADEWHKLEVHVEKQVYRVVINGAEVGKYTRDVRAERYIGLQTDGGGVAFRDIQLKAAKRD